MYDYKTGYIILLNAIVNALNQIERLEIREARDLLVNARFEAEEEVNE